MNGLRVSIYIVTYRNAIDLNNNISSILASGADVCINVINNHSNFHLDPVHEGKVKVLHNNLRPDFSTGHLARNWNQALIHGFRDLNYPSSDVVITVQDDVIFKPDWFLNLLDLHRRYNFITMGVGDAFCSYTPIAVKRVGLWDERFCNIGGQEGDYFLRSLIYNRDGCSINDLDHGRVHNAIDNNSLSPIGGSDRADSLLIVTPKWNPDRKKSYISSMSFFGISQAVFMQKWGLSECSWKAEHFAIRKPLIPNYVMYPYFEMNVEDLHGKNYVLDDPESRDYWTAFGTRLTEES